MRVSSISNIYNISPNVTNFKGGKEEVISSGFKEFVSDALPIYKAGRTLYKLGEGKTDDAIKQGVGVVDNIVMQPTKQAIATAVAAKAAVFGSVLGPVGTVIGAGFGYFGTLLGWGKIRNSIVDGILDK